MLTAGAFANKIESDLLLKKQERKQNGTRRGNSSHCSKQISDLLSAIQWRGLACGLILHWLNGKSTCARIWINLQGISKDSLMSNSLI